MLPYFISKFPLRMPMAFQLKTLPKYRIKRLQGKGEDQFKVILKSFSPTTIKSYQKA
jgi:hypothetical protein